MMRLVRFQALLVLTVLAACAERQVPIGKLPPPPAPPERALVETPPPADIPEPPLPELKPGTDMSQTESETLYAQGSPKGPPDEGFAAEPGTEAAQPGQQASTGGPPPIDATHLVGLSQAEATQIFGQPAQRKDLPPSQVWTYHSDQCDLTLFFYPEVGGSAFRALTYQFDDRGANDATHTACLSSLAKPHAS